MGEDAAVIKPHEILNFPVTVTKATKEELIIRDHSGAEIKISSKEKLVYERIW